MQIRRNLKYRIYPTDEQKTILLRWEGILRFLWNLCHEQRLMGLARSKEERKFVSNYDQQKQMTDLLSEYTWIAEVQCQARVEILADLDKAWSRCFKGLAKQPHWKHKGDSMHIYIPSLTLPYLLNGSGKTYKLSFKNSPAYRNLGPLKIILDRPTRGTVKSWDIKRNQDEWYATARCLIEIPDPIPVNNETVGIDRGVKLALADSDGRQVENPRFLVELQPRIKRAEREVSRKKKGSNNQKKARKKVARLKRLVARRREVFINTESLYYAKNYGTVVIEKLQVKNMTASAKGTIEEPGKNVRQKAGLNKAILDSGWGLFNRTVGYKLEERGGTLKNVNPYRTSQTCPACSHISKDNRKTQSEFKCVKCDHTENADVTAAKEIGARGVRGVRGEIVVKKSITKISKPRGRKKTAVKPTVVQPAEDNLIATLGKPLTFERPDETGTDICEGIDYMNNIGRAG